MFQLKWLWKQMEGNRLMYVAALILSSLIQILFVVVPGLGGEIVRIFIDVDPQIAVKNIEDNRMLLLALASGMIGITLFRTIMQFFTKMLYEKSSQNVLFNIRNKMFELIHNQDTHFFNKISKGDLVTRMTGDLDQIRHTLAWVVMLFVENLALFTFTIVYFFSMDWLLTLCFLVVAPIIFFMTKNFPKKMGGRHAITREKLSRLNNKAQENIAGNRVVKAFAREEYEKQDFDKYNFEYADQTKQTAYTWLKFLPKMEITSQSLWVIHMVFGGVFVVTGRIDLAEFTIFVNLLWAISNAMRMLGFLANDLQRAFASIDKIIELYYAKPEIVNEHNDIERIKLQGNIEFKNVSLEIDNKKILKDISFDVKQGETVVIMGPTGSGKSMLVNLIARFYDTTEGKVLVDGKNVKDYELDLLRANIGLTTQDVMLFSDTIDGNIAYGNSDMSSDNVKHFAKLSCAGFIERMPEQYDTIIGERGVGLSGGQKQRIALARAMAIKPPILILDDTTSAVDLETELEIQENIGKLDFDCTKIIIAQRTSSAKNADKIIILDEGKILEMGSHQELMAKKGYYYEIFALQNDIAG
ncbi:MAG: ABC transporter ATP-binding protein [Clostridiales bacterium]|nr:ABC transporter ATP-binding protein [Clostridiales bacterium]